VKLILLDKTYHGFEDIYDLDRDIHEMFIDQNIPSEFQGTIKVLVTYEKNSGLDNET